jgi:hypothetical protein
MDIEVARIDPHRTCVQISCRLGFPWLVRWSADERAAERRCSLGMGSFLDSIAARLVHGQANGFTARAPTT